MDETFNDQVRHMEKDKPNLWKPTEDAKVDEIYTDREARLITNKLLKKIAAKLAPEYDLTERDFVIRLDFEPARKVEIKSGVVIRCYFSVVPYDDAFDGILRRTLQRMRMIKRNKLPEKWHVMDESLKWVLKAKPKTKIDIPKEQTDVQVFYKVVVKDKETGIVSIREGLQSKNTVTKLIAWAREELIDLVDAAKPLLDAQKALKEKKLDDFDTQQHSDEHSYSDEAMMITAYDDLI